MVRILGITLPDERRIDYALTLIYGIGWNNGKKILQQASVKAGTRVKSLTEEEIKKLTNIIDKNYKTGGNLREIINENRKRLKEIGCYRGTRHIRGLPVHGQRTKSNARTKRGKRKTIGALKKEVWAKLDQSKTRTEATPAKIK